MIETAALFVDPREIHYHGFDLFEMLTEAELVKEFSLRPPSRAEVQQRLERTGANIHLHQGYSRDTLKAWRPGNGANHPIDFLFIDGGHSLETIASDWQDLTPPPPPPPANPPPPAPPPIPPWCSTTTTRAPSPRFSRSAAASWWSRSTARRSRSRSFRRRIASARTGGSSGCRWCASAAVRL